MIRVRLFFYDWVEVSIRAIGVEDFIAVHDGHEVFGFAQVDDVVGVAREHDDRLYLISAHLIVENLGIRVGFIAKLDQSMA